MRGRYWLALLPLLLSGCLLPQPDTPPIKPPAGPTSALPTAPSLGRQTAPAVGNGAAANSGAATANPVTPPSGASAGANTATPVSAPAAASARLSGSVRGLDATAIAAVAASATPAFTALSQTGTFALTVVPGSYALAFKLADGRIATTSARVTLAAGQNLAVAITLSDAPLTATLDEQTPLVMSATPTATPSK